MDSPTAKSSMHFSARFAIAASNPSAATATCEPILRTFAERANKIDTAHRKSFQAEKRLENSWFHQTNKAHAHVRRHHPAWRHHATWFAPFEACAAA